MIVRLGRLVLTIVLLNFESVLKAHVLCVKIIRRNECKLSGVYVMCLSKSGNYTHVEI